MSYRLTLRSPYGNRGYGGLGWADPEHATYGLTDSDLVQPSKGLCGSAKVIQGCLKDQGYYNGPIDGVLGSGSVAAIKKFSADKGIGNISWPNATFCDALRSSQYVLITAEYARRHPPTPDGQVIVGPDGQVVAPPPEKIIEPPEEDNTRTYLLYGGFAVAALLALGLVVYARSEGGGGGQAMRANKRGSRRRHSRATTTIKVGVAAKGPSAALSRLARKYGGRASKKRYLNMWDVSLIVPKRNAKRAKAALRSLERRHYKD